MKPHGISPLRSLREISKLSSLWKYPTFPGLQSPTGISPASSLPDKSRTLRYSSCLRSTGKLPPMPIPLKSSSVRSSRENSTSPSSSQMPLVKPLPERSNRHKRPRPAKPPGRSPTSPLPLKSNRRRAPKENRTSPGLSQSLPV